MAEDGDVRSCPICADKILCGSENKHFNASNSCLTCGRDLIVLLDSLPRRGALGARIDKQERSAMRIRAMQEIGAGRTGNGLAILRILRRLNDREADALLGSLYDQGTRVRRDPALAWTYFASAARKGLAYAQYNLGVLLLKRDKNARLARGYFRKAASSRNAHARIRKAAQEAIAWLDAQRRLKATGDARPVRLRAASKPSKRLSSVAAATSPAALGARRARLSSNKTA